MYKNVVVLNQLMGPPPLLSPLITGSPMAIHKQTSHMQKIIQIYPCLLKLSCKQDTILNIGDFSTKN